MGLRAAEWVKNMSKRNVEERFVQVSAGSVTLEGDLSIPSSAEGIILFAHGGGSSRFSPRNRFVARFLQQQGLATLLVDLLTLEEQEIDREAMTFRSDISLLSVRVVGATDWIHAYQDTQKLTIGYFGASTGAAAALIAATQRPKLVHAIVSRGGRPDFAQAYLQIIQAPTLLIVGGNDTSVIPLNEEAFPQIAAPKQLEIVAGAGHLFEEPEALEAVAHLATDWFRRYLTKEATPVSSWTV